MSRAKKAKPKRPRPANRRWRFMVLTLRRGWIEYYKPDGVDEEAAKKCLRAQGMGWILDLRQWRLEPDPERIGETEKKE